MAPQAWRCGWCLEYFVRERRALAEVEALRRVVKVDMTTPFDPPICDTCYQKVMSAVTPEAVVTGEAPPLNVNGSVNILLR